MEPYEIWIHIEQSDIERLKHIIYAANQRINELMEEKE